MKSKTVKIESPCLDLAVLGTSSEIQFQKFDFGFLAKRHIKRWPQKLLENLFEFFLQKISENSLFLILIVQK